MIQKEHSKARERKSDTIHSDVMLSTVRDAEWKTKSCGSRAKHSRYVENA